MRPSSEEVNLGQRTFRCYITPKEFEEIIFRSSRVFQFKFIGSSWNQCELVDIGIMTEQEGLEYSNFIFSETEIPISSYESWAMGDLHFSNLLNMYGYIDMLQLSLKTTKIERTGKTMPINQMSYRLFNWIAKEIRDISELCDDLCVISSGSKLHEKTRITSGIRKALLEGTLLTGGNSPTRKPVVVIGLCHDCQNWP